MDKIVIYDTETTNSTIWGSIIELGAVVVDKNLKEIGKLNIRGRMPEGEVPSAKALLVNSTSIDLLTKGNYSHYDFLGAVEIFSQSVLQQYLWVGQTLILIEECSTLIFLRVIGILMPPTHRPIVNMMVCI